ncbi:hypothetical protein [uncultured Ilyobacter sp.]|uniref:hypothetical protein n=1 Tax=uncultured Ilyobacter sp. TaxID=544433 RepID=UPI0029F593DA|nr:hypothetical protein [uncultured Ilyobacter sp.]
MTAIYQWLRWRLCDKRRMHRRIEREWPDLASKHAQAAYCLAEFSDLAYLLVETSAARRVDEPHVCGRTFRSYGPFRYANVLMEHFGRVVSSVEWIQDETVATLSRSLIELWSQLGRRETAYQFEEGVGLACIASTCLLRVFDPARTGYVAYPHRLLQIGVIQPYDLPEAKASIANIPALIENTNAMLRTLQRDNRFGDDKVLRLRYSLLRRAVVNVLRSPDALLGDLVEGRGNKRPKLVPFTLGDVADECEQCESRWLSPVVNAGILDAGVPPRVDEIVEIFARRDSDAAFWTAAKWKSDSDWARARTIAGEIVETCGWSAWVTVVAPPHPE